MTYADLAFFHWIDWIGNTSDFQVEVHLENYPKLHALKEKVAGHPKIAEWIQKRPETNM